MLLRVSGNIKPNATKTALALIKSWTLLVSGTKTSAAYPQGLESCEVGTTWRNLIYWNVRFSHQTLWHDVSTEYCHNQDSLQNHRVKAQNPFKFNFSLISFAGSTSGINVPTNVLLLVLKANHPFLQPKGAKQQPGRQEDCTGRTLGPVATHPNPSANR